MGMWKEEGEFMLGITIFVILGALLAMFPFMLGLLIPVLFLGIGPLGFAVYFAAKRVQRDATAQRLRVLVVDDDEISVTPLLTALSGKSADINFVQSGDQMMTALKTHPYDLVFLDHMMPDINGEDALQLSERNTASSAKVSVIFFTGAVKRFYLPDGLENFEVKGVWDKRVPFRVLDERLNKLWEPKAA
jgi:CheY-like chemotaxis protein